MSALEKLKPVSIDEYLVIEETGTIRHELVDGNLFAMVGTTQRHNLIAGNLFTLLRSHFQGTPCRVFMADLKVQVQQNFYYPDLVVSCQPGPILENVVANPILIAEVLSTSTADRDRLEKRIAYQRLPSLQEYVLITQDKVEVKVYRLQSDDWEVETYGCGEVVRFAAVRFEVMMDLIYENAELEQAQLKAI